MAERYVNLFSLDNARYKIGAPAMVYAGALLLDKKNNQLLIQLKLLSLSNILIKAIKVKFALYGKRFISGYSF